MYKPKCYKKFFNMKRKRFKIKICYKTLTSRVYLRDLSFSFFFCRPFPVKNRENLLLQKKIFFLNVGETVGQGNGSKTLHTSTSTSEDPILGRAWREWRVPGRQSTPSTSLVPWEIRLVLRTYILSK